MARKKKNDELFADYFEEWIDTYKVGAVRDVTLRKYRMTNKTLRKLVPNLKISQLDRRAYQRILNEYGLTHEKQTTMDFHHHIMRMHPGSIPRRANRTRSNLSGCSQRESAWSKEKKVAECG